MNGYVAFHKGRRIEVYAETLYQAQTKAAAELGVKPKRAYEVSVMLAEKDGVPVTHVAVD